MKLTAIAVFVLALAGLVWLVVSPARHLTQTPPQKAKLINGTNTLSFPVVQGKYLLRIGRADLKPASFGFSVSGMIHTPVGPVAIDETYAPRPEVLSQQVSGGYISRALDVSGGADHVKVQIIASFPASEELTCTFQGIK